MGDNFRGGIPNRVDLSLISFHKDSFPDISRPFAYQHAHRHRHWLAAGPCIGIVPHHFLDMLQRARADEADPLGGTPDRFASGAWAVERIGPRGSGGVDRHGRRDGVARLYMCPRIDA